MTSEIRANTLKNRVGLGTVSFTNTGVVVSGIVTANNFAGTIQTASQPNITSLGSLTSLNVTGTSVVGNFKSTNNNYVLGLAGNNSSVKSYFGTDSSGRFLLATGSGVGLRFSIDTDGKATFSGDLDVDGHTNLDNVSISGVSTFSGAITANSTLYVGSDLTITDKIVHNGDTNTTIRFPSADTFTVETGGTERIRCDADGVKTLNGRFYSAGTYAYIASSSTSNSTLTLKKSASGADSIDYLQLRDNSNGIKFTIHGDGTLKILDTITHEGDTDTKIRFPAGNTISMETTGNERVRINSSGKVIVGNNGTTFGNAAVQAFIQHGNTAGESGFSSVDTTSVAAGVGGEIAFHGKYNTGAQDYAYYGHIRGIKENATNGNTACALTFHTRPNATAPIERLRIDSSGRLIVGGGTHAGGSALVVKGGNQNNYSTIGMFSNHTNPANNTLLTQIRFGANASAVGADIRVYADADWGTNDYPTRMEFHTTPDGSNSKQVRLKIEKDGRVNVLGPKLKLPTGTSNPGSSVAGDSYYNTSDGTFKIYDGSIWGSVVVAAKGTQQNPAANSTELAATGALAQYYFKPNTGDTAFQQYACGGLSNLGTIPSGGPSWVNSHSSLIIIEKGQVGATSTMKMSQANYGKFIKESITRNSGTTPYVYWAVFDGGTLWGIWRIRWTGATYSTWFSNHNYSEGVNTAPSGTPSSDVWKTGSGTTGNALATGTYTISNNTSLNRAVLPEQDYNSAGSWGIHYKRLGSGEHYPWRNSAGNYTSNGYFEPSTSYSMGTDTRYIHYVYLADN